ncbi:MAG: regulatory protein TetR [Candidatus Eremiobacteraeota bacterium]|jgi:TetR/AcrR family transcriptional repressor of nem operon|nr:regulatory protein TetR [Candidatus Eremiobacteraeota bacterium]
MTAKKSGRPPAAETPATQRILDVAEQCAQTRGFNGFSYADVAEKLLCTKASLHYHFPSKADLGRALIERYHRVFMQALEAIDRQAHDAREKLRRYAGLYDSVMRNDRMCLCGMFAAEFATLPAPMQDELRLFFDANEVWLAVVLQDGRRAGELAFLGSAKQRARSVLGALEGAMLVARAYGDGRRFQSAAKQVLADLGVERAVESDLQSRPAVDGVRANLG